MTQPTLISLGSINMDFQVRTDRWPDPGETMLADEFLMTAGGKAANVAVLAQRLGVDTVLIGHVGDDILADKILRDLERVGIDLRHVRRVEGASSAVSMISVLPGGEKTITLAPNANLEWDEERDGDEVVAAIGSAPEGSGLVTDLEIPVGVVQRAVEAARERKMPVVLDPSPAERVTDELCRFVDVLTPNTSEAGQLTGIEVDSAESAERAGRALFER
ncbi:MAG TPA: PfkB family carbohydrate kinase, partial [Thermomicrobiales bacterium]|nr:PfkB family carbohydrate kinase [Thermomicrobiales bacterium]